METATTLFGIWFMHALIGSGLSAPILLLGRKRISWTNWELLAFVIPFLLWTALMVSPLSQGRKSLANLGEPIYISFAMPVMALIQVAFGRTLSDRLWAFTSIVTLSVIAAATFFIVPFKPE